MARHERKAGAVRGDEVEDSAEEIDLRGTRSVQLRDRLDARGDGRDDKVLRAAVDLRASIDRLLRRLDEEKNALIGRAAAVATKAAPVAGAALALVVVLSLVRRSRRSPAPKPTPVPRYRLQAVPVSEAGS